MGAGMIVVPIVSLVTPKMDTSHVDKVFECLEEKVVVSKRKSIEE